MSFGVNVAYHSRSSPRWGAKVRISVLSICWTRAYPVGIRPFNDLTQYLRKQSNYPIAHGGFGDIWKCSLPDEVRRCWLSTYSLQSLTCRNLLHRQNVAVKAIRSYFIDENDRIKKDKASTFVLRKINTWCWFHQRLRRELIIWQKLIHDNILPLYGVALGFGPFTAMVCPWAKNGSLIMYLESHRDLLIAERFKLVSLFSICPKLIETILLLVVWCRKWSALSSVFVRNVNIQCVNHIDCSLSSYKSSCTWRPQWGSSSPALPI